METIALPAHLPLDLQRVHLAHISPLTPEQSKAILDRIIAASKLPTATSTTPGAEVTEEQLKQAEDERAKLDYAFIDPTKICGRQHISTAILQAAIVASRGREKMKTKTVHSEVIWTLSPGNNVGESLKRFGLSPSSTSLLLIRFSTPDADPQEVLRDMRSLIPAASSSAAVALESGHSDGQGADIDTLIRFGSPPTAATVTDWAQLNKIYKLGMPSVLLERIKKQDGPWSEEMLKEMQRYEEICCTTVAMKLVAA